MQRGLVRKFISPIIDTDFYIGQSTNLTTLCISVVKLRSLDTVKSTQAKFLIHTMQILPHKYCKTFDVQKILPVSSECETVHYFRVEPNNILEVCIAKYWSNFGTATLSSSIEFHGVETKTPCKFANRHAIAILFAMRFGY